MMSFSSFTVQFIFVGKKEKTKVLILVFELVYLGVNEALNTDEALKATYLDGQLNHVHH